MRDHTRNLAITLGTTLLLCLSGAVVAGTIVKGHNRYDRDNNGFTDAGIMVNGHYTSVYAYDDNGDWYWDLGDGRILGTVADPDSLDGDSSTVCDYVNNYRADFGNDPFMDSGWIINTINCQGVDSGHYVYLIVHEDDPRYDGDPDWAIWGDWEYHILTVSGSGNLVHPFTGPENHAD